MQNIELQQLQSSTSPALRVTGSAAVFFVEGAIGGATGNVYLRSFIPCLLRQLSDIHQRLDIATVQVRQLYKDITWSVS